MKLVPSILLTVGLVAGANALLADEPASQVSKVAKEEQRRAVDLAICLDTSGSMSGLINAAKQKLWAIVNDLALAQPTPELRVALLTFGTPAYGEETGYVLVRSTLTEDLDRISEQLFALTTEGGDEYVGRVLSTALKNLEWSPSKDSLKIIVVAGNESADQDQVVSFRDACRAAISNDIIVNSIYCGNPGDQEAPLWAEVAKLADGQFATIDQDHGIAVIETPFDAQLAAMSTQVNFTYLPYGTAGKAGAENQMEQDANASSLNSAAAASRAQTKAGKLYYCSWDLVDAVKQGQIDLADVKDEDLPENLRNMTLEERKKAVEEVAAKRAECQKKIQELSDKRQQYIQEEMKKTATDESAAFDKAIRGAVREQARSKGFEFKDGQ